jgi:hypothetical protein
LLKFRWRWSNCEVVLWSFANIFLPSAFFRILRCRPCSLSHGPPLDDCRGHPTLNVNETLDILVLSQDDTPVEVSEEQEQVGDCRISFQPFKIGAGVRIKLSIRNIEVYAQ